MPRLTNAQKKRCNAALDELAKVPSLNFIWGPNWTPLHGGNTSHLQGLKPCSRVDSFKTAYPYHVGLAEGSFRKISQPLVEATFSKPYPSTSQVVSALRDAVKRS